MWKFQLLRYRLAWRGLASLPGGCPPIEEVNYEPYTACLRPPSFPGLPFQVPWSQGATLANRCWRGLCGPDCTSSKLWKEFRVNRLVTQSIAIPSLPCLPGQAPSLRMLEPTVWSRMRCPPVQNFDRFHQPCLFSWKCYLWCGIEPWPRRWTSQPRWRLSSPYH